MNYFKILTVDLCWLEMEIAKGTIFYKQYSFATPDFIPCGEFRDGSSSYDRLSAREVLGMINRNKNVYWRN